MPDDSIEGKEVEDLEIGQKVLMTGQKGVEYFPLPRNQLGDPNEPVK